MEYDRVNIMDFYNEIYNIWKASSDKKSVEKTFRVLTRMEFEFVFKTLKYIKQ